MIVLLRIQIEHENKNLGGGLWGAGVSDFFTMNPKLK